MGIEIERKFLVRGNAWRINAAAGDRYCQGYLCLGAEKTVRVRTCGGRGFLTVKGPGDGVARREYEYEIPLPDALEMLEMLCEKPLIIKDRYKVSHQGLVWEIDKFYGENSGLVIAEIELVHEGQEIPLPDWVEREVSSDPRYFNASLVRNPWNTWNE